MLNYLLLSLALLPACVGGKDPDEPGIFEDQDADDDGVNYDKDCNDANPSIFPGAVERCDAADIDEDCNGFSDNADPGVQGGIVVFHDADADGYGEDASVVAACEPSPGYVVIDGDCDDSDPAISPAAVEICDELDEDEDCNGVAEDADPGVLLADQVTGHADTDADGFGDPYKVEQFCDIPSGWVRNDDDCDDAADWIHPDASEVCDGVDDDCDGLSDENSAIDASTWYADDDDDNHGDLDSTRAACERPPGFVASSDDCDDTSVDVYPGAPERCDGEDDNCDGTTDEDDAVDVLTWYADVDLDGYGDASDSTLDCEQPAGHVDNDDDCNDARATINPSRTEVCDGADVDEDCDGLADDDDSGVSSTGKTTYYADRDSDTFGNEDSTLAACDLPSGYVTDTSDCDDTDSNIHPGGSEICDSANDDEDCDGTTDDSDTSVSAAGKSTYYVDADADNFGLSTSSVSRCDLPSGYATNSTDCDDGNAARNPGAYEACDAANTDEDCDSLSDDSDGSVRASTRSTWYLDADADGYGVTTSTITRCDVPSGYAAVSTDCNDGASSISPGADEVCFDSVDDDCNSSTRCDRDVNDAEREFIGDAAGDYAGYAVSSAGDQNNDGVDDFIIGATGNDAGGSSAGAAYVINGGGSGDVDLSVANAILVGEDASDAAGTSVAGVGDVDGDGWDDMLVGAPGDDDGGSGAGKAYYLRGSLTGTYDLSVSYGKIIGENASDAAGSSVAGVGDVNGDGKADLLIGAPGRSSSAGGVYLFTSIAGGTTDLSVASAILTGESSSDYAGTTVDGAGDVNGDGYDDILVGAYGDDDGASSAGASYIFLGPQTGTASLSTADAKRRGVTSSDYAGFAVAGAGDINNDGYDDVLVGAYGYGSYGIVYVEYGPMSSSGSLSTYADATLSGTIGVYGKTLAGGGDLDLDDYADIVIGNPTDSTDGSNSGSVSVFLGPVSGARTQATADYYISGGISAAGAGFSAAFTGIDGSDLLLGAYTNSDGGTNSGAVFWFDGGGL
ncbi:MAG: MopE-related protein [Myxococcota bacterium]